jgi:hypothetical protein
VESKIFNAGVLGPGEWVKYGYLDGLKTFDNEVSKFAIRRIAFFAMESERSDPQGARFDPFDLMIHEFLRIGRKA